jgi:hypothetical protein
MDKNIANTEYVSITSRDVLGDILRRGAQQMPARAIENEVAEYAQAVITGDKAGRRNLYQKLGLKPDDSVK